MTRLEQRLLISQGGDLTTIVEGVVPLFNADTESLAQQVNFLRCNSVPGVQIVYGSEKNCSDYRARNAHLWKEYKELLIKQFERVKLRNEKFQFDFNPENWTVLVTRQELYPPED